MSHEQYAIPCQQAVNNLQCLFFGGPAQINEQIAAKNDIIRFFLQQKPAVRQIAPHKANHVSETRDHPEYVLVPPCVPLLLKIMLLKGMFPSSEGFLTVNADFCLLQRPDTDIRCVNVETSRADILGGADIRERNGNGICLLTCGAGDTQHTQHTVFVLGQPFESHITFEIGEGRLISEKPCFRNQHLVCQLIPFPV